MPSRAIRVLLVDDSDLFRQGLAGLLARFDDITVVGQAYRGDEAVQRIAALRPDVVLMECTLPGMSGIEAARQIRSGFPHIAVSMLTVSESEPQLFGAIRAGARGYLLKSMDLDVLHRAILSLAAGGGVVAPPLGRLLLQEFARVAAPAPKASKEVELLTIRERQVLDLLGQGHTNFEIAEQLVVATSTVKVHLRNIIGKLPVRNRQHAAAFAMQAGLVGTAGELGGKGGMICPPPPAARPVGGSFIHAA
ncbi:MAG: response regulator [Dehalococcoidia bacterium]